MEDFLALAVRLGVIAILGAIALWICVVAALWLLQRPLLYMAPPNPPGPPPAGYSVVMLTTEDGLRLTAWYHPAQAGRPTIVFYSAQGADLAFSAEWTRGFASAGMGLLLVSYRGFDANPGSPTEEGLYRDGRAALAWLAERGTYRPVIMGLSLGTGTAAQMAAEAASRPPEFPAGSHPLALVLLAPYRSVTEIAAVRYPFAPVRLLLKDRYDTQSIIAGIRMPLMIAHGDADELIPYAEGQAVFARAREPKQFITLQGAGHNFPCDLILPELERFLAKIDASAPQP
jgi:fermentation-respiration switch protein FrsA (DUF1100 family)